jgi:hypothetical protein
MNAHVYRLTVELNHERGLTPDERTALLKAVNDAVSRYAWVTASNIKYVDYLPVDDR